MATLAELQTMRDQLIAARGNPEQRIRFRNGDVEEDVWFRTDAELAAALRDVERRISLSSTSRISTVVFHTSKGV